MSSEKIRRLERYYENVPYGNKSLSSEIHGPVIQNTINSTVKMLVQMHDAALEKKDDQLANTFKNSIYKIDKQANILKGLKEEHAMNLRSRSNWTDWEWADIFFTEKGTIDFDENMDMILGALNPSTNNFEERKIEDVSRDWELIGDWMQPLMNAKQELIKARNSLKKEPPFDIDFFVNNLIKENWRSMISDPDDTLDPNDYHNGFRLQQILHAAADENGNIPVDYNLEKTSFDPTVDNRLHNAVANDLKRAFNPTYETEEEVAKAKQLMNRIS